MIKNNDIKDVLSEKVITPKSEFSNDNTYSSLFLPPIFDIPFDPFVHKYIVNLYLNDAGLTHSFKRPLFLLLQTKSLFEQDFVLYDARIRKNRNFVYHYFVGFDKGMYLNMYVFECPQDFEVDYDMFVQGKYSKFSDYLKRRFVKSVQMPDGQFAENHLYGVVNKTLNAKKEVERIIGQKIDKESEYFSIPDPKIEVFRYEKA